MQLINDKQLISDPVGFTKKLLELKAEMDSLVEKSFKDDLKFQKGRDKGFQNFMNEFGQTPAFIANYADVELKRGLKGASESEIESKLGAIVRLFCCLNGRDIFLK